MAVAVNDRRSRRRADARRWCAATSCSRPTCRCAVAPGDEFEVSVGRGQQRRRLGAKTRRSRCRSPPRPPSRWSARPAQKLKIGEMREGVALFRVKARDGATGAAGLGDAGASPAALNASRAASRRSWPPISACARPRRMRTTAGAGQLHRLDRGAGAARPARRVPPSTRWRSRPLPLVAATGLLTYLTNFPHLCTEQLVSRAVPALVLAQAAGVRAARRHRRQAGQGARRGARACCARGRTPRAASACGRPRSGRRVRLGLCDAHCCSKRATRRRRCPRTCCQRAPDYAAAARGQHRPATWTPRARAPRRSTCSRARAS